MIPYFPHDTYVTPADTPRHWLHRLTMGSRAALHLHFIWQIIRARGLVSLNNYTRSAWAATAFSVFEMVEQCGGRFHIKGLDHIRNLNDPVVYVSNHMSSLEGNIFGCLLPQPQEITFVIKESLRRYPVFGPVIGSRDPITVGRINPRDDLQKVLREGVVTLEDGRSIILFPQHTRTPRFIPAEFNSLGVKLAQRAGVPVVPIAVKTDFLINGRYLRDFGPLDPQQKIYFAFGQPSPVTNSKQSHQSIVRFIEQHLAEWQHQR